MFIALYMVCGNDFMFIILVRLIDYIREHKYRGRKIDARITAPDEVPIATEILDGSLDLPEAFQKVILRLAVRIWDVVSQGVVQPVEGPCRTAGAERFRIMPGKVLRRNAA